MCVALVDFRQNPLTLCSYAHNINLIVYACARAYEDADISDVVSRVEVKDVKARSGTLSPVEDGSGTFSTVPSVQYNPGLVLL